MFFMSVVFLFPSTPQTDVASMNYTVVVFGGVLLLSLVWYYFPKYGGVHWFTGPQSTIEGRDGSQQSVQSEEREVKNAAQVEVQEAS